LVARYSGAKKDPNSTIPISIALGGTFTNPKPTLVMDEQSEQVKEAVTEAAKQEGAKAIQKAAKGTEAEKIVGSILGKDSARAASGDSAQSSPKEAVQQKVEEEKKRLEEEKKKVEEEAKQKIQNLLNRKKN